MYYLSYSACLSGWLPLKCESSKSFYITVPKKICFLKLFEADRLQPTFSVRTWYMESLIYSFIYPHTRHTSLFCDSKNSYMYFHCFSLLNCACFFDYFLNPLNAELNPICHLLELLGVRHILHVRGLRVNIPTHTLIIYTLENTNSN
jgi:hypothetical protein